MRSAHQEPNNAFHSDAGVSGPMKLLLLVALTLWSLSSSAGEPSLTAKRLGEDVFQLELVTDQTMDVAVAQRALLPAAQQVCAGKVRAVESLCG
jgi:hypothetical protein